MTWKDKAGKHLESRKPMSKLPEKEIRRLLNDLDDYEDKWSPWEIEFIANVSGLLDDGKVLTDGQCDKLEEVHKRHTEMYGRYKR